MALLKEEAPVSARKLLVAGIPAFVAAMAFSLLTHQLAHRFGEEAFCGGGPAAAADPVSIIRPDAPGETCGAAALAALAWTLGLAVVSFILMLRRPSNLLLISLGFINATDRVPETATMFLQYLIHSRSWLRSDESAALSLIGFADPTIPMVILCAMTLLLVFFSVIIVHDVKTVRYKWVIAAALFAAAGLIETGVAWLLRPGGGG
jgi:hypothetical protein